MGAPVIEIGVDNSLRRPPSATEREAARGALGATPDGLVVLYLGRMDPTKGIETLLQAIRLLDDPRILTVIAGAPSKFRKGADTYATDLRAGAPRGVRFVGRYDDPRPLLWAADVVVVPSIWEEPLSRVPVEAMACGVPVVGSRIGGTPEILSGPFSALLFEPGDPDALVVALCRALPELGGDRHWNEAVRDHVANRFTVQAATSRLLDLVSSLEAAQTRPS
jgi:glycosyltransferase involved in cell wall biosynthesis